MPSAELIAIGTELLLGEIVDTNTQYLARQLRDCGIDLFRNTTIGDNQQRITTLIQEAFMRVDIVITTGGLGPTVDDPTRDAAALAFGLQNEFHPELWEQIQQRFFKRNQIPSENNKKQAYIPQGAIPIENPVGTAPAFIVNLNGKALICLPGVPREMEYLTVNKVIPWLKQQYGTSTVFKVKVLHVAGVPESAVDEKVAEFEKLSNPTVGLLAHPGIVDIRITAKAESHAQADLMVSDIESQIYQMFPDDIYGVDEQSMTDAINQLTRTFSEPIMIYTSGFSTNCFKKLNNSEIKPIENRVNLSNISEKTIYTFFIRYSNQQESARIELEFQAGETNEQLTRQYSGAPELREEWGANYSLNFIRQMLISATKLRRE